MSSSNIIENPSNEEQEKLVQSQFNINVAFYVHLKAYDNKVRDELEKLQKLFVDEFKDYENAIKISCSIAKYEKIEESFFELEI